MTSSPAQFCAQFFVDGRFRTADTVEPVVEAATGEPLGDGACVTESDIDDAVAAARRALPDWRATFTGAPRRHPDRDGGRAEVARQAHQRAGHPGERHADHAVPRRQWRVPAAAAAVLRPADHRGSGGGDPSEHDRAHHRPPRGRRGGRRDHPVELSAGAGRDEARARAGRRLHRGPQGCRPKPPWTHWFSPKRGRGRVAARGAECGVGWSGRRRLPGGTSRRRQGRVHRVDATGGWSPKSADACCGRSPWNWAANPRRSSSTTPIWTRRCRACATRRSSTTARPAT